MFVLCVKDEKTVVVVALNKVVPFVGNFTFSLTVLSLILVWLVTPHLWPQVWLSGLSVAVGKLWCRSCVV